MSLIGKKILIIKGPNKGRFGTVTHADGDSFRMAENLDDISELGTYDRIENIVRSKE